MRGAFEANVERLGLGPWVEAMACASPAAAARFAPSSLDFVFIDSAHDEDSVRADLEAWWPLCRGLFCGHDCAPGSGVERAVRELARSRSLILRIVPGTHFIWTLEKAAE